MQQQSLSQDTRHESLLDNPTADEEDLLIILHGGFESNITSSKESILFVAGHGAARILFVSIGNGGEGVTISNNIDLSREFARETSAGIEFILAGRNRD